MNNKIKILYLKDILSNVLAMAVLWNLLIYVMKKVNELAPNLFIKSMVCVAGIGVGIAASAASFAVIVHLKKNKFKLYNEELETLSGRSECE